MMDKMNITLDSKQWRQVDEERIGEGFRVLGFKRIGEIMGIRFFDLLNLDRVDSIRAWEMVRCLYEFLNKNEEADKALEYQLADQYFPFAEWRKAHKYKNARVVDLVLAFDMNERALLKLFENVTRAFYKSEEYNSRFYKYGSFAELKQADSLYEEVTANV